MRCVEVFIWVLGIEEGSAEVAEVSFALETLHMVAAHGLLTAGSAGGTELGVFGQVGVCGELFGGEFGAISWETGCE